LENDGKHIRADELGMESTGLSATGAILQKAVHPEGAVAAPYTTTAIP